MFETLGLKLTQEEAKLEGKHLLKAVMSKWINAADTLLEMIVCHLPSPRKAQKYRTSYLYEGPQDDAIAQINERMQTQRDHQLCTSPRWFQPPIEEDSLLSVEFSLVPLLLDKRSELWEPTTKQERRKICLKKLSKEQFS
ncbi:unnamed protein product (macronuclear) [Paramecium tetraurelia]|uniref:Uncharacterized protein n=1 Tax=Paramecium tetraurelia TaxID=5888 RepID=A0CT19_PARTE|nr:uncharacterized protein GSPATT00038954001 [Paramecium tetraurelia]CAK73936.1 unnamed protein product [Paramecium tetraurelia]|eukprot:XP_001441333.1 hypothetical protein (macronuclear) [Paramecium tetraurelia strain d4-2]